MIASDSLSRNVGMDFSRISGIIFFIPFPFPNFRNVFFHSFPVPELEIQNPLIVQSSFHGWLTIWTSDPILFGLFKEAIKRYLEVSPRNWEKEKRTCSWCWPHDWQKSFFICALNLSKWKVEGSLLTLSSTRKENYFMVIKPGL